MFDIDTYRRRDAGRLVENLRDADAKYISKLTGTTPRYALLDECSGSDQLVVFRDGETPAAILGRVEDNVWLQTSRLTDGRASEVIRAGRRAMQLLPSTPLYCIVPRDDKRVRLLCKAIGFTELTAEYPDYRGSGIAHVALWRIP